MNIEDVAEVLDQKIGNDQADFRRREFSAQLLHILPLLDGAQNRRVGGWTSNPPLFQLLHQRSFVVTRRRLGEMLLRLQFLQGELLPGLECRQLVFEFFVFLVLVFFRLLIDLQEAIELQHRSRNAEPESLRSGLGVDIDGRLVEDRGHNLRSHKPLPDELVNLELIFF